MRGKGGNTVQTSRGRRITPAYAGKRPWNIFFSMHRQDHPRLCGEKWHIGQSITRQKGSPPPMRGKAWKEKVKTRSIWITPAYAGKSSFHLASCFFCRDHPRLCGEKLPCTAEEPIYSGSPPPMRGKGHGNNRRNRR